MAYKRIKCPKCDQTFGQEARFLDHLTDHHGIADHLSLYVDINHGGIHPTCECSSSCQELVKWSGWKKGFTSKYIRGHNARIDSVYFDKARQEEFTKKRNEGFKSGRNKPWNKNLTKDSDERVKKQAKNISLSLKRGYESGSIKDWHKADLEKVKVAAKKISETKKQQYESGELSSWNKGLTKYTDERVARIALKISSAYNNTDMGNRIKIDELKLRIAKFDTFDLVSDLDLEYKTRRIARLKFKCKNCGNLQEKSLAMLEETPVCFHCRPKDSKAQLEIFDFVKSHTQDAILSDRNIIAPKELDIWVPSRRLAIEYNGLYYHSEKFLDESYHQQKLDVCKANSVTLLSIYEDEWRDKRDIVEGMILHRLGKPSRTLNARSLKILPVKSSVARSFFDQNHLEGYVRSKVVFGLFDKDELVAAITLRIPFHKKYRDAGSVELGRCVCKRGYNVRGWLGRLSRHAKVWARDNGYHRMITYVDSRVGSGTGYVNAGWTCTGSTGSPRFWWTDFVQRYNRFKYKADKSKNMTQQQVADEAGVVKLFGCNNMILEQVI